MAISGLIEAHEGFASARRVDDLDRGLVFFGIYDGGGVWPPPSKTSGEVAEWSKATVC